jgi:hypothetical protein
MRCTKHHSFPGSETPSIDRSYLHHPLLALRTMLPDNNQYLSFAAPAWCSTRVYTQFLRARHSSPGYSPRSESHLPSVRLLQLKRSPNTLTSPPKPQRATASRRRLGDSTLCRVPPAELTQPRGCVVPKLHNYQRSDRSPHWDYPNLIDSDTSCRKLMPVSPGTGLHRATVR